MIFIRSFCLLLWTVQRTITRRDMKLRNILLILLLLSFSAGQICAQTKAPAKNTTTSKYSAYGKKPVTNVSKNTTKTPAKKSTTTSSTQSGQTAQKPAGPQKFELLGKRYRGNADMGFSYGLSDGKGYNRFGFSSTHGYQVVPIYLFIGGGVAVDYYFDGKGVAVPLYFDLRSNFGKKSIPFIDLRAGGSPIDIKGLYMSPSLGVRIPIGETRHGVSIMAGYTYQTGKFECYYYRSHSVEVEKNKLTSLHFKIGFEW